jgi:hypothetical protein
MTLEQQVHDLEVRIRKLERMFKTNNASNVPYTQQSVNPNRCKNCGGLKSNYGVAPKGNWQDICKCKTM